MEHCIKLNKDEIELILLALSELFTDAGKHVDSFVEPENTENLEAFGCVMEIGRLMERFNALHKRASETEKCCGVNAYV